MSDLPRPFADTAAQVPTLRLSEDVNEELKKGQRSQVPPPRNGIPATLPDPVFPRNPKLFAASDEDYFPKDGKRHYTLPQIYHSMRGGCSHIFARACCPASSIRSSRICSPNGNAISIATIAGPSTTASPA